MTTTRRASLAIILALTVLPAASEAQWRGRPPPGPPPPGPGGWYGMAGCGLGSLLFGPINSPGPQILAATTNGTFGTQTFGITSGTSNCVSSGVVALEREQTAFAEVNFTDLKREMAAGGGEYVTSFATLLGCDDATKPALAKMMQARYETLLPSERTTPGELLAGVHAQISADANLATGCRSAPAKT